MKNRLVWAAAMTAAIASAACSQCGEEKAPPPAAPVAVKESPAVPGADDARPDAAVSVPHVEVPEANGPGGPVPESLCGVWEKTDQPFRGMRIEFAPEAGMAAIPVVAPPVDDAAAVAFFAQKNGDDKERGAQFAACMPKVWTAGAIKYADLKPTARGDEWVGANELRLFRTTTCSDIRTKREDVALRLVSKDELVATMADPRRATIKTETWKRLAP